uniref:Uncharacterized protein n=1 Tax=Anopheles christyi TaxID=43041 RepID=A0A182K9F1_9DIPT
MSSAVMNSAGILQKWSKLRRRCASFKSVSGPASLDSDTNFILAEHPGHYQIISTATGSPVPPRATLVPAHHQSKHQTSSHHHHQHHPLYHGHHHLHHSHGPQLQHQHHHHHHNLPHYRGSTHPHHHQHHHHSHHLHHQQLHNHPLVDYPLPGSHLLDATPPPPPLASGYDPKNWELRHSSSSSTSASSSSTIGAPPAIPAALPGDEYWQHFPHEPSDVKLWRLGAHQTYAHRIHVNPPQRRSAHSIDWEYNVQRYENMCDSMAPPPPASQRIFRTEKLQYYDELSDVKRTATGGTTGEPGTMHESSNIKVAKEIKLPSLKTFKSASMRLPGQKSSMHEVQQLLRSKFNRIHAGLRKRRALSVQEVFQVPGTPAAGGAVQVTPTKPTFYVPSPLVSERTPHRGMAPRYNEEEEADDTRAPFLDAHDHGLSADQHEEQEEGEEEGPVSLPYISETMLAETKKVTLRSTEHSPSPRKERTKTWYRSIDFNAALQKLDSHRHSLDTSAKCTPKKQTAEQAETPAEKEPSTATKPNFSIGGRVSLRERVENMNLSRLRPSKVASSGTASPVPSATPVATVKKLADARKKIRPRSHSPLKNIKINLSPVKKPTAAGGPPVSLAADKSNSKRESIGLFGRLNRMMHQHGLGGLGSSDKTPVDSGARKQQNGKVGSVAANSGSKNGPEGGSVTSGASVAPRTDKAVGLGGGNVGVSFGGNVSKQSTIQKLTQLSSCNRREQQQQQQVQQSKTETTHERDRKSKQ